MSSTFHINTTKENIRKSFTDFEQPTLKEYTLEDVLSTLEKGEKDLFLTKSQLGEVKDQLEKGEFSEVASKDLLEQIKNLEPVMIKKSETESTIGYFLTKEDEQDSIS